MTFHNQYVVKWEIDIEADSPREAAEEAFELMQKPTTATFFEVEDDDGNVTKVDLTFGDEDNDDEIKAKRTEHGRT